MDLPELQIDAIVEWRFKGFTCLYKALHRIVEGNEAAVILFGNNQPAE